MIGARGLKLLISLAFLFLGFGLCAALLSPAAVIGLPFLQGWSFALEGPERALAAVGIGLALAALSGRGASAGLAALLAGALLGFLAHRTAVWPVLTGPDLYRHLHLVGPGACVLAGLGLVLPDRWRPITATMAAFVVALALGLTAAFNDPAPELGLFAGGAAMATLWLAVSAALLSGRLRRPFWRIAERIAGSWLMAIGLLLAGAQLLPPKPVAPPLVIDPAAGRSRIPGLDAPAPPDAPFPAGPRPRDLGRSNEF